MDETPSSALNQRHTGDRAGVRQRKKCRRIESLIVVALALAFWLGGHDLFSSLSPAELLPTVAPPTVAPPPGAPRSAAVQEEARLPLAEETACALPAVQQPHVEPRAGRTFTVVAPAPSLPVRGGTPWSNELAVSSPEQGAAIATPTRQVADVVPSNAWALPHAAVVRSVEGEIVVPAGWGQEPAGSSPSEPIVALREEVITYTVQPGDTIAAIARRFGLERETIVWSNAELEANPDALYAGQVLDILPLDGVYHTVGEGETLSQIAARYRTPVEEIVRFSTPVFPAGEPDPAAGSIQARPIADTPAMQGDADRLDEPSIEMGGMSAEDLAAGVEAVPLVPGQKLVVPGGTKAFRQNVVRFQSGVISTQPMPAEGHFMWPVRGQISQGFWNLHRAIDIEGQQGDVVVAVDDGVVVYARWECSGYGNLVIVDHNNGYVSYYAHLYGFYVDVGQSLKRGQPIGVRGNTGYSTGPHLHFEIRYNGVQCDPLSVLPAR